MPSAAILLGSLRVKWTLPVARMFIFSAWRPGCQTTRAGTGTSGDGNYRSYTAEENQWYAQKGGQGSGLLHHIYRVHDIGMLSVKPAVQSFLRSKNSRKVKSGYKFSSFLLRITRIIKFCQILYMLFFFFFFWFNEQTLSIFPVTSRSLDNLWSRS